MRARPLPARPLVRQRPDVSLHVWTGLNTEATSPQLDPYVGGPHDGFAQDAMYALR